MLFFFVFVVVSVLGAFLDADGFLVVGGVFADGACVLVDAVGPFVEVFAANLSPSH